MEAFKVLVTGSNGLCGSAIQRLSKFSYHNFVFSTRKDADLRDPGETSRLISEVKPDCVIHTAAKVGGVGMNLKIPYTLCSENLYINNNVIRACVDNRVEQLMAFSSVCVFPDDCKVLSEDNMHGGPPHDGTLGYAHSKRMVDVLMECASREFGDNNWTSIIPGNIFGPADLYDEEFGHCIPSLIAKMYFAKKNGLPLKVWGNGESEREFIYVDDLARVLIESIGRQMPRRLMVCGRKSLKIREVVGILSEVADWKGIIWETEKPNGQAARPSDKTVFDKTFPNFVYSDIHESMRETWNWFVDNYPNVRSKY